MPQILSRVLTHSFLIINQFCDHICNVFPLNSTPRVSNNFEKRMTWDEQQI
jgi:hypothetical protein